MGRNVIGVARKVPYGGYVIWQMVCPEYSVYDIEKPGYDYAVATLNSALDAKNWIDEHPDGNAVVEMEKEDRARREREYWDAYLMDLFCG